MILNGTIQTLMYEGNNGFKIVRLTDGTVIKGTLHGVRETSELELDGEHTVHPKHGAFFRVDRYRFKNASADESAAQDGLAFIKDTLGLARRGDEIWKQLGPEAKEIIEHNPYDLASLVKGIGFKVADSIAEKLGISQSDPRRIDQCILHVLRQASEGQGHAFLSIRQIVSRSIPLLDLAPDDAETVEAGLARLLRPKTISDTWVLPPAIAGVTFNGKTAYYLQALLDAESIVAAHIQSLVAEEPEPLVFDMDELPARYDWLSPEQLAAVEASLRERIVVITGGPGTGKSTITKATVESLRRWNIQFLLCAPTGRAAKRMQEITDCDAMTIHRMLGYNPHLGDFTFGKHNPLPAKLVICDEASMIDIELARRLMEAIGPGTRLVLVGDADQLEPVGPGRPFKDVITSGLVKVCRLTHIYRQGAGSMIVEGCTSILGRSTPAFGTLPGQHDLFRFTFGNASRGAAMIVQIVNEKIPQKFGIKADDIQVLCPNHDGDIGTKTLNLALQAAVRGKTPEEEGDFLAGDKVVQTTNDYERFVMNGDVGVVLSVRETGCRIRFGDVEHDYDRKALGHIDLAYAMSIHKAQGSEYPAVVVVGHSWRPGFLTRNMIYTAVSRGRELVVVLMQGDGQKFEEALLTEEKPRNSLLAQRIRGEL